MDNKFKDLKREYDSIQIPNELEELVNSTIKNYERNSIKRPSYTRNLALAASVFIIFSGMFVATLNMNQSFAQSMSEVPIIGSIAKLLTFKDYEIHSDVVDAEIKIPKVEGLSDKKLEQKINDEIYEKMKATIKEAEQRALEDKQAFIETGGTEEEFKDRKTKVKVDYDLKSVNDNMISFTLYQYESSSYSYSQTYYYNINIRNNKNIKIEDILGKDYKKIIDKSIYAQIEERKKDENNSFFEGEMGFNGIKETPNFYINEDGKVVIVFDKYEIAPGAMGPQEFVIE
ncbi:DUF3298 and DUF4163 domain-containing protein [Tepidibacter hydrothermalis]|uniref:DUF3298 domain-containing protein n=1 Tax=Tepidibacter hydrothermalis TaxID=3036126 RepID=A0ABY8EB67_9FIRM|nr:DUF3298 and DUF4163 domain-containing protein [Tepidibacter hydrothermalis]WFD10178.1 DUF3298 domain-containing protein [Tepidibacter hydrothermalis]